MTLLDYPGRVACTVFLAGCDFACPYCHNSELLSKNAPALMEDEEFFKFLGTRKNLLEGVAITGGEPCLNKELPDFLRKIKDMGFPVKLDTNGNHPDMLRRVAEEGLLDYVAMDIKNSPERYAQTVGLSRLDLGKINASKDFLIDAGKKGLEYEFRTTVVKPLHDEESFKSIGPWIKGAGNYYLQNFTDRDTVVFAGLSEASETELENFKNLVRPYVKCVEIRGL